MSSIVQTHLPPLQGHVRKQPGVEASRRLCTSCSAAAFHSGRLRWQVCTMSRVALPALGWGRGSKTTRLPSPLSSALLPSQGEMNDPVGLGVCHQGEVHRGWHQTSLAPARPRDKATSIAVITSWAAQPPLSWQDPQVQTFQCYCQSCPQAIPRVSVSVSSDTPPPPSQVSPCVWPHPGCVGRLGGWRAELTIAQEEEVRGGYSQP